MVKCHPFVNNKNEKEEIICVFIHILVYIFEHRGRQLGLVASI